ncbi:ABC transporter ATP-binding protein [Clostridioides difficile]
MILLEDVNLIFKVRREKRIKDILIPGSKKFNDFDEDGSVHAIQNMNLEINDGERVAIIGHNGAGKSTFLKMVSGIYPPSSGKLVVDGRISSMFELATGFEMEQSGWDNIYLRGLMLGESPKSIKSKIKDIAEFSELGSFLDMPVKYYSSGMFVRLAFSVSTAINPDILLLDEVVAAGDAAFITKAQKRMEDMMKSAKIMVLVTHGMQDAIKMCNRCIWFERGRILMDGRPENVVNSYLESTKV